MKIKQSKRQLIRALAYGSVLSLGGVSGLVFALSKDKAVLSAALSNSEEVSLINHTTSSIILNDKQTGEAITIAAGGQVSLSIESLKPKAISHMNKKNLFITDVLHGHLAINSEHAEFNGIFPTSFFKTNTA